MKPTFYFLVLLCLPGLALAQTTRYVSTTGTQPASGATSWANSTTDLQGAINLSNPGDVVWVRSGVYKPGGNTNTTRTISFSMKNGVAIYGGFTGNETQLSQRLPINPVIGSPSSSTLSGDIGALGNADDNSYHVVYNNSNGLTNSAVLDGFVITGGNANSTDLFSADVHGGGIYTKDSSPTIRNCSLQGNQTNSNGGGIYIEGASSYLLENLLLSNNLAYYGGGFYTQSGSSSGIIRNCRFLSNATQARGGGLYVATGGPSLFNTVFDANSSGLGGAIFNQGAPTLINCTIRNNTASQAGRAIANNSQNPTLINSIVWGNGGGNTFVNLFGTQVIARYSLFDNGVTGVVSDPSNITGVTTSPFASNASAALSVCSPAINVGNPASVTGATGPYSETVLPATDLAGNPRIFGGRVDMGAVEYQAAPGSPTRLYVKASQTANVPDGQSWDTAFPDLQSALTYPCRQSLTEIWVARGTYRPASGSSFSMLPGVAIYGGFEGGERDLSQRPPVNPVLGAPSNTTLAGNGSRVITNPSGLTTTAVLDGFVITGGIGNNGGGVYNDGSSPSFRNCLLRGNSATFNGGAMCNFGRSSVSSPVLTNCVLQGNSAASGGAMFNDGSSSGRLRPVLINCVLQGNSASNYGGAMYNDGSGGLSSPVLTNCSLQNNSARLGGAMYNDGTDAGQASPVLINCSLQGNTASQLGGVMYTNNDGFLFGVSSPVLTNCVLWNNGGSNSFSSLYATTRLSYSLFEPAAVTTNLDITSPNNLTTATSPFISATSVALLPCSPAINSGDLSTTTVTVGTTDLAGNPRFFGGRIDMGAVEYQAAPIAPPRLYVSASQTANVGDGQSWDTAFPDLQSALTYPCSQSLTEIWVARGTYKPTSGTNRGASFAMLPGVAIYGGFEGRETSLGQRPTVNPVTGNPSSSTLSGDIDNDGTLANNSYHVLFNQTGLTTTSVLDGFVITGGNANGSSSLDNSGGGVYNNGIESGQICNPSFRNCSLVGNSASSQGGAMYNNGRTSGQSSPGLTNCSFVGNSASSGGAMFNDGGDGQSSPVLTNCTFQTNSATRGGATFNFGAGTNAVSSPVLTNCTLQSNSATQGGAMYNQAQYSGISSPVLTNCTLQSNSAAQGGATFNFGAGTNAVLRPVLTNCTLQSNSATQGGATFNFGFDSSPASPVLTNSVYFGNGGGNTFYNVGSTITATYSLFDNSVTGYVSGPGNLTTTTSPFVSATSVALLSSALAINAGDPNTSTLIVGTTDLVGNPRIFGGRIDMGAIEYQGPLSLSLLTTATPNPVCAGASVALSVTASGGSTPYSYTWVTPVGINLSGASTSAVSASVGVGVSGVQMLTLTVADAGSPTPMVSTSLVSLTVNALPTPTLSVAPSGTLTCALTSVTLTATGGMSYTLLGGTTRPTNPQGVFVVSEAGTYTVVAANASGCIASTTATLQSNTAVPATVSLTPAPSGTLTCAQTSLTLTASSTSSGVGFQFLSPGGASLKGDTGPANAAPAGSSAQQVINAPGTYTVIATGANGCTATATTTIESNTVAPANVSLTPTPSSTLSCAQTSLTLTASATGTGLGYAFRGPSGLIAGSGDMRMISTPGTYTVSVTDANGCTATSTTAISQNIVTPTASLSTSTGSLTFCANSSLTLVAGGGVSYSFSSGATQIGGSNGNTATVSTAGTYTVTVSGANGCTATASVSVSTVAVTTLTSVPPASVSVCETSPVSLSVAASGADLRYQWYKNSGLLSGQTMPTLSISSAGSADNGSYYVTVRGVCGTTATNPTTLTVRPRPAAPSLATSSVTAVVSTTPLPLTPFIVATGNTLSFSGVNGLLNPPVADISTAGVQNFSVTATDGYGCVSVSTPFSLTVYLPFPPASQSICRGSAVVLSVLPTAQRYQWYRVNGTALLRLTDVAGVQRGTGTASLTLLSVQTSGSYVCQATLANGSVVSYGPYAIGVAICGGREATAAPETTLSIMVAPNPLVGHQLRAVVRGAAGERLAVSLYDQQGRLWRQSVIERAADEQPIEWSVGDVPVGTLLLRASTDRQSQTIKVIHD